MEAMSLPKEEPRTDDQWKLGHSSGQYDALRFLALTYAEHPDYHEGWKP